VGVAEVGDNELEMRWVLSVFVAFLYFAAVILGFYGFALLVIFWPEAVDRLLWLWEFPDRLADCFLSRFSWYRVVRGGHWELRLVRCGPDCPRIEVWCRVDCCWKEHNINHYEVLACEEYL
jgi:hypothetical protein